MHFRRALTGTILAALCLNAALGQTPLGTTFTYQGRLNQAGQVFNGPADLRFDLYDAGVGGNLLGSHALNGVAVSGGLFTVQLNAGGEFGASAFNGEQRWLEISVNGTPLWPRQALTAEPYALFSRDSAQLAGQSAASYRDAGNLNTGVLVPAHGGTGLNSSAASSGSLLYTSAGGAWSVRGPGADAQVLTMVGGVPTWGDATGLALPYVGVLPVAGGNLFSLRNTGPGDGLSVQIDSTQDSAAAIGGTVASTSPGSSSAAVRGANKGTGGSGIGVWGSQDGGGYGVFGGTVSGVGVFGRATQFSNVVTTYGVYGQSDGAGSAGAVGVFGLASAAFSTTYGVFGQSNSAAGWGVWAQGRLGASGTKSFQIDHPDDPVNKYLLHYSTESPEVINFYRGTAMLDGAGEAVVTLPSYFAKINKTPSYQLTAVGAPMPMLHIASEIDEAALNAGAAAGPNDTAPLCSFRIAGGAPGAKVCWRVEALRNDRWVQQHGAPVAIEKDGFEKGKYQHPELYGQPKERGVNYEGMPVGRASLVPLPAQEASAPDAPGRAEQSPTSN